VSLIVQECHLWNVDTVAARRVVSHILNNKEERNKKEYYREIFLLEKNYISKMPKNIGTG